jgi:PPM family protein phosphatase
LNVTSAIKVERLTDVGMLRDHNEDAVASDLTIGLMLLADGMGGYKAGEVASEIAVLMIAAEVTEAMQNLEGLTKPNPDLMPESSLLIDAIVKANAAIYQVSKSQPHCAGMGTTLVASIFSDNKLAVAHIGDSRMYCLRGEVLTQLTEDHSLIQEQINAGLISQAQAKNASNRNLVTRALGIDPEVELDWQEFDVKVGDIYLMCSDGLTDLVEDAEITQILREANGNITLAAKKLVQLANDCGGTDNISVVIALVNTSFAIEKNWVSNFFGG